MAASGTLLLLPATQTHFRDRADEQRLFAAERDAILDALPVHVALLDASGEILVANAAWRAFAATLDGWPGLRIGENYLDSWRMKKAACALTAEDIGAAIMAVLERRRNSVEFEYCARALPSRPWFSDARHPLVERPREPRRGHAQ